MTVHYNHASELATITNTWSVGGTATDPDTVTFVVTDPTGSASTYTFAAGQITKSSTGVYTKDISCSSTVAGTWQAVLIGTGVAADVAVVTWETQSTDAQQMYCTPETLKSRTGITDTLNDLEILGACTSASRWIDSWCDRQFFRATTTRTFAPSDLYCMAVDDLVSVTTLKTDPGGDGTFETTWATSDYQLLPLNPSAAAEQRPYTSIRAVGSYTFPHCAYLGARSDRVQVVGVFGWPAVPAAVKQAAAILSTDMLKLGTMAFGIAGYGEYGAVRARPNPIVVSLLAPYRKHPVLVG